MIGKRLESYIEAELVEVMDDFDEIKSWNNTQQEAMLGETYWAIKEELEYE